MSPVIEEILYPAMEDYELDIMIGQGPSARSVKVSLQHFTLIGATTRTGLLTSPLRSRFGLVHRLDFYTEGDLVEIIARSAPYSRRADQGCRDERACASFPWHSARGESPPAAGSRLCRGAG